MKKESEYVLLKKAEIETTKICAGVLHIPEEEALRLPVRERIALLYRALPLMTPEQKRKVKDLMEAPRAFWTPGPESERSFAV